MIAASVIHVIASVLLVGAFSAVALGLLWSARTGWFSRFVMRTNWRRVALYAAALILAAAIGAALAGATSDSLFGFVFFAAFVAGYMIQRFAFAKAIRRMLFGDDDE